jgi:CRP/FNR family cyclic AMP-dependent transcriptional regulator
MGISIDLRSAYAIAMQAARPRPWPIDTKFEIGHEEKQAFDADAFLNSGSAAKKIVGYESKETVFRQGDPATGVLYVQTGVVKLVVVNETGREVVVMILGQGDFFGEGCLAEQAQRTCTAETIIPSKILAIEKPEMIRLLHAEHAFSDWFMRQLLSRNMRIEEDLVDLLFNSCEKRLARTLLLLGRYGKEDQAQGVLPPISQETLAEMIGTTRPRVNFFMNKFRRLGFIEYDLHCEIHVNSLLNHVLQD